MSDVREYCREVEDHLTRVNEGHLVRIVGPGFELVRQWAEEGIPLSVVFRGIDLKADRQRAGHVARSDSPGRAPRPLRIEFCEADVRDVYDGWRRAVGLPIAHEPAGAADGHAGEDSADTAGGAGGRRRSLTKHLDRAIDRLVRVSGSTDVAGPLRDVADRLIEALGGAREAAKGARGPARAELAARLPELDARLLEAARAAAGSEVLDALARQAEIELAPFRTRLAPEAWRTAIAATVDRLLRDRFGLPTLELRA
jgi:hypothetical protein